MSPGSPGPRADQIDLHGACEDLARARGQHALAQLPAQRDWIADPTQFDRASMRVPSGDATIAIRCNLLLRTARERRWAPGSRLRASRAETVPPSPPLGCRVIQLARDLLRRAAVVTSLDRQRSLSRRGTHDFDGSISSRMRSAQPRRRSPAAARTIASYWPSSSLRRRVSTLPRRFSITKPRPSACNCADAPQRTGSDLGTGAQLCKRLADPAHRADLRAPESPPASGLPAAP